MKKPLVIIIFLVVLLPSAVSQLNSSVSIKSLQKFISKKCNTCIITEISNKNFNSKLNGRFFQISNNKKLNNYAYLGRVYSCKSNGCNANSSSSGSSEYFDYYVVFNLNFQIKRISIFNYQATHGHAVCARSWLKQFYSYKGDKQLHVGKNIDAISGATISSNAFTIDIQKVYSKLPYIKEMNLAK